MWAYFLCSARALAPACLGHLRRDVPRPSLGGARTGVGGGFEGFARLARAVVDRGAKRNW